MPPKRTMTFYDVLEQLPHKIRTLQEIKEHLQTYCDSNNINGFVEHGTEEAYEIDEWADTKQFKFEMYCYFQHKMSDALRDQLLIDILRD